MPPAPMWRSLAARSPEPPPVSLMPRATTDGYARLVSASRRCTRSACSQPAVATLTYVYADQTAVLGPLATLAEPHTYDLCADHSQRLSAPRGWNVLRLAPDPATIEPSHDDLLALADAVREAGRPVVAPPDGPPELRLVKPPPLGGA
jgi:uncharacterized protein DUF3499